MPLRDVKDHPKRKVNLIAVVVEFSIPRMSVGTGTIFSVLGLFLFFQSTNICMFA